MARAGAGHGDGGGIVNSAILNPRRNTATAIARSLIRIDAHGGLVAPTPAAVIALGHDRFATDLSISEAQTAIVEAWQ